MGCREGGGGFGGSWNVEAVVLLMEKSRPHKLTWKDLETEAFEGKFIVSKTHGTEKRKRRGVQIFQDRGRIRGQIRIMGKLRGKKGSATEVRRILKSPSSSAEKDLI